MQISYCGLRRLTSRFFLCILLSLLFIPFHITTTLAAQLSPAEESLIVDNYLSLMTTAKSSAAKVDSPITRLADPTMTVLNVVRNWDSMSQDARARLSPHISLSEPDGSMRTVNSTDMVCGFDETSAEYVDTTHFRVIYTSTGTNAVTTEYLEVVKKSLEFVWSKIASDGYIAPLTPSDGKLRINICDIIGQGFYGLTAAEVLLGNNTAITGVYIDNDYNAVQLLTGETRYDVARITIAHELFHSMQFAVNYMAPSYWLMEANAVWNENNTYPSIDDYTFYLSERFSNLNKSIDIFSSYNTLAYGSGIFFIYLTDNHYPAIVRDIWSAIGTRCASSTPPQWCSTTTNEIDLVDELLQTKGIGLDEAYTRFNVANYQKDYDDGDKSYFATVPLTELKAATASAAKASQLNHLAADFYRITPQTGESSDMLSLSFSGGINDWGIAIVRTSVTGSETVQYYPIESASPQLTLIIDGLGQDISSIVLIVANTEQLLNNRQYTINYSLVTNTIECTHVFPQGWSLMGLPFTPLKTRLSEILNNSTTYSYVLTQDSYADGDATAAAAGSAFWVYFPTEVSISTLGLADSTVTEVALTQGWNTVSVPYPSPAQWDSSVNVKTATAQYSITDEAADTLIKNTIYTYSSETNDLSNAITPEDGYTISQWEGFAIYAKEACTLVFPVPAQ